MTVSHRSLRDSRPPCSVLGSDRPSERLSLTERAGLSRCQR